MEKLFLAAFLTFGLLQVTAAQSYYTEEGFAGFRSETPLLTFNGTTNSLVGKIDLDNNTIDFYIDLLTLKTGIAKRDRDMYETLEVEEYPFAEFFGELTSDFDPQSNQKQEVTVNGNFKVHGVEREVTIDGTLQKTEKGLKVSANWILELTNYDIDPPSLLNYKVNNELTLGIEAVLKPQS